MLLGAGLCGAWRAHAAAGVAACAGPGRAVAGGVRWGGRGVGASGVGARACRGPALQGFGRWASGCALLLRVRSAGGAEPLCVAWWGPLTIVEAARVGAGGGVEGARVCWWALLSTGGVYRRLSAS